MANHNIFDLDLQVRTLGEVSTAEITTTKAYTDCGGSTCVATCFGTCKKDATCYTCLSCNPPCPI
jgi:hypothetical protein